MSSPLWKCGYEGICGAGEGCEQGSTSVKPCSAKQEWEQSGFTQNSPRDPIRRVGWGPSTGSCSWTIFGKEGDGWRLLQTEKHWKATKVQLEEEL